MNTNRSSYRWIGLAAAGLLSAALVGCGSSGGGGGDAGSGGSVTPPVVTPPTIAVPAGKAPITLTSSTSADTFAALQPVVKVGGVTISSPPVVTFSIADANDNAIVGFGSTSKSSTATVASYPNISFVLAKLVPGKNGSPSKWVSYIVTTVPTTTAASAPTRPTSDSTGTLVDNKNGTYTYTFYRDVTKIKDQVAAMTVTGLNNKADLGDLTYEPNLVHRLTIQVGGNAPGTGTNTANAVQVTAAVPMTHPVNVTYDFIPATGKSVTATDTSRDIVATAKCVECHSKLGEIPGATKLIDSQDGKSRVSANATFHGGSRYDTKYCVVCHTDQQRYGQANAVSTNFSYPALARTVTQNATTGLYSQSFAPQTNVADGVSVGDFPAFVHKIHMGERLVKKNYNFVGAVLFNETTYPQPITNCVKCHDGSSTSTAKTTNGDNWKQVPSRLACGACHDGIDFATNKGVRLADAEAGKTSSSPAHIGGAKADDSQCALCHTPADIPVYHLTVDPAMSAANNRGYYSAPYGCSTAAGAALPCTTVSQQVAASSQLGNLPSDVYKIDFQMKQAVVSGAAGAKKLSVVYRVLKNGSPVTFNKTGFLIDNVDGTPSIMYAYAIPQDGTTSPADWNFVNSTGAGIAVRDIRDGKTATGCPAGTTAAASTQTGPDSDGYYTATLGCVIPDNATMVTAALGVNYAGFIQLNASGYPKGIRLRESQFAIKTADGYTARRQVVDNAKCNSCHGQLGVLPTFHAGARNNGEGCAMCHQPNTATGHIGSANNFGGGWSVAIKNLVHGIHGSSKRTQDFTYEASADNLRGFNIVTYPGVLSNCEQCHVAGGYDYSGTAVKAAVDARTLLWFTDAKGDMSNPNNVTSIGLSPWVTKNGKGQTNYTSDNLVSSPIASSCFGCHDSAVAVAHMETNGGSLVRPFSTVSSLGTSAVRPAVGVASTMTWTKSEQCMFCHQPTSAFGLGIKSVHAAK